MSEENWVFETNMPRCEKCGLGGVALHRHHLKSETLFIFHFQASKADSKWYKKLVARYTEFRPQDVRLLCADCHEEIHAVYRLIVVHDYNLRNHRKNFCDYTIKEATELMLAFKRAYFRWIKNDPLYKVYRAAPRGGQSVVWEV